MTPAMNTKQPAPVARRAVQYTVKIARIRRAASRASWSAPSHLLAQCRDRRRSAGLAACRWHPSTASPANLFRRAAGGRKSRARASFDADDALLAPAEMQHIDSRGQLVTVAADDLGLQLAPHRRGAGAWSSSGVAVTWSSATSIRMCRRPRPADCGSPGRSAAWRPGSARNPRAAPCTSPANSAGTAPGSPADERQCHLGAGALHRREFEVPAGVMATSTPAQRHLRPQQVELGGVVVRGIEL